MAAPSPGRAPAAPAPAEPDVREVLVDEDDLRGGKVELDTDQKHAVKVTKPRFFRLALLDDDGAPRQGVRYRLEVEGRKIDGETGSDGLIEAAVPETAEAGTLPFFDDPQAEKPTRKLKVNLAAAPPVRDPKGVQVRLKALGIYHGKIDGQLATPASREAVKHFQQDFMDREDASGDVDDATRVALADLCDEE